MYKELTKVQINGEDNITLAIKISDNCVHNFILSKDVFAFILSKDVKNWKGLIHNKIWEVQKLKDKIKMFDQNYEFIYRFSQAEWEDIRQQFATALRKKKVA